MHRDIIGQATAQVAVLPARAAYLIAAGSRSGFRRAAQEASTRWAGMTELIVPVPSRGQVAQAWKQLIEIGRLDCVVNVDVSTGAALSAAENAQLPLVELRHIDRSGPSLWTAHPSNIAPDRPANSSYVIATGDSAPLWEITAAGDLTEQHVHDLGVTAFARRPRTSDEIGRAQLSNHTLLDRTVEQFGEYQASSGPSPSPSVLWITPPNSLKDCIWYWNCRALRSLNFEPLPMTLLPHRGLDSWVDFAQQFGATLARPEDIEPDVVICSLSIDESGLDAIADLLGLKRSEKKLRMARRSPPPELRKAPFTYQTNVDPRVFVTFGRMYGRTAEAVIQTGTPRTMLTVDSPVRFAGSGYALLRISSSALDHLPRRASTASLALQNADWYGDALQIRTNATSRYRLDLTIPSLEEATWALVREVSPSSRLSDKGRLAHRLDELAPAQLLLDQGVHEVIRELTTPRSKELLRELARLRGEGHSDADLAELAAGWGGRAERRYKAAADLRGTVGKHASHAAEALATESWAERGLEVRCDQCSLRSFVPLRDAEARSTCPACRAVRPYEAAPDLRINYRLNSLVDRASDQGVIAHLMAAAALRHRDPRTHLLMGVDVAMTDGTNAEVDLFGVHGSKVIAGEAKTSPGEFDEHQLRRDVSNSERLGVDLHILASPNPIPDETVEQVAALTAAVGLELLIVEGSDVRLPP